MAHYVIELWEPEGTYDREGYVFPFHSDTEVTTIEQATEKLLECEPQQRRYLTISQGGDARQGLEATTFRKIAE